MTTLILPPERRRWFADENGQWTTFRDEDSVLDYTIDWSATLNGDTIATSGWETTGVIPGATSNTTTTTTIFIGGGSGEAKNVITTTGGRSHVRRLRFIERQM